MGLGVRSAAFDDRSTTAETGPNSLPPRGIAMGLTTGQDRR